MDQNMFINLQYPHYSEIRAEWADYTLDDDTLFILSIYGA